MLNFTCTTIMMAALVACFNGGKIKITNQTEFDNLGKSIIQKLSKGERDINVKITPGTYFYIDNHVDLSGKNYPDAVVSISGRGATLIAKGVEHKSGEVLGNATLEHGFVKKSGENIDMWSGFMMADGLVEVVFEQQKLCRVKNSTYNRSDDVGEGMLQLTQWYSSRVYPIVKTEKGYIYFTASNLTKGWQGGWNVNNDYQFGRKYPRYRILSRKNKKTPFYECLATRFLVLGYGTMLRKVCVKGIRFCGNARDGEKPVISCLSPYGSVDIVDCDFIGMRSSRVISVGNKNEVTVENCSFSDCYENGVIASHQSQDVKIVGCVFSNMGIGWTNSFCVSCAGKSYYVADNDFQNFGYGAIALGFGYSNEKKNEISGIVEKNKITFTPDYKQYLAQYGLMDGGAIYLSTQNDHSVIRYNMIDNYIGAHGNHGIFCDDGALGFEIYGNVITNIDNGRCIAARRDASIEYVRNKKSKVHKTNINNVVRDNVMDGCYLFWGNEQANNGCVKGTNYLIAKGGKAPELDGGNYERSEDDVIIQAEGMLDCKVIVNRDEYHAISKSVEWKSLKTKIKRK